MSHRRAAGFDTLEPLYAAGLLVEAQRDAAGAVSEALVPIVAAAGLAAERLRAGGRLIYAGAGSSGLMALADALELPGTFGVPRDRIVVLFAGAPATLVAMTGESEDDTDLARRDIGSAAAGPKDCVIAVSASGSTPYTLAALGEGKARGAATIAFANNAAAPLLAAADVGVLLATPPELVAGSTRMGAGTAQKIALNVFSTLMAVELGHIHDGLMVNVQADNAKLVQRAVRIVATVAQAGEERAADCLERAGGSVKLAVLMASGAASPEEAARRLEQAGGRIRPVLAALQEESAAAEGVGATG
ncbi:N-acetylmuramic acid 6-phosphate etherase [Jiella sp. M17.18]|uniref:N-acetylmuramic acid 6-phosphate etherase n=1 Tax=Jiella sp. M17.18 TaxID=3234247 RepID=UPI0034DF233B